MHKIAKHQDDFYLKEYWVCKKITDYFNYTQVDIITFETILNRQYTQLEGFITITCINTQGLLYDIHMYNRARGAKARHL